MWRRPDELDNGSSSWSSSLLLTFVWFLPLWTLMCTWRFELSKASYHTLHTPLTSLQCGFPDGPEGWRRLKPFPHFLTFVGFSCVDSLVNVQIWATNEALPTFLHILCSSLLYGLSGGMSVNSDWSSTTCITYGRFSPVWELSDGLKVGGLTEGSATSFHNCKVSLPWTLQWTVKLLTDDWSLSHIPHMWMVSLYGLSDESLQLWALTEFTPHSSLLHFPPMWTLTMNAEELSYNGSLFTLTLQWMSLLSVTAEVKIKGRRLVKVLYTGKFPSVRDHTILINVESLRAVFSIIIVAVRLSFLCAPRSTECCEIRPTPSTSSSTDTVYFAWRNFLVSILIILWLSQELF